MSRRCHPIGVIQTVHHRERAAEVAVGSPECGVQQGSGLLAGGSGEPGVGHCGVEDADVRPTAFVGDRPRQCREVVPAGVLLPIAQRDRGGLQPLERRHDRRVGDRVACAHEQQRRIQRHPTFGEAGIVAHRIDVAVEHHGPDAIGEHQRVDVADARAVTEAPVGELGVADGHAELVEVAGGVVGADVVDERCVALHTGAICRGGDGFGGGAGSNPVHLAGGGQRQAGLGAVLQRGLR